MILGEQGLAKGLDVSLLSVWQSGKGSGMSRPLMLKLSLPGILGLAVALVPLMTAQAATADAGHVTAAILSHHTASTSPREQLVWEYDPPPILVIRPGWANARLPAGGGQEFRRRLRVPSQQSSRGRLRPMATNQRSLRSRSPMWPCGVLASRERGSPTGLAVRE